MLKVKRLELTKELEYDDTSESPALTLQWPGGVSQTLRALDLVDCELKATDDLRCFHVSDETYQTVMDLTGQL